MGEEEIMVILCSQCLVFYKGDSKHLPNGDVEGCRCVPEVRLEVGAEEDEQRRGGGKTGTLNS